MATNSHPDAFFDHPVDGITTRATGPPKQTNFHVCDLDFGLRQLMIPFQMKVSILLVSMLFWKQPLETNP